MQRNDVRILHGSCTNVLYFHLTLTCLFLLMLDVIVVVFNRYHIAVDVKSIGIGRIISPIGQQTTAACLAYLNGIEHRRWMCFGRE